MALEIGEYRGAAGVRKAFRAPCGLHFPTGDGSVRAAPGDWVVLEDDGNVSLWAPSVFVERYRPVDASAAALNPA